MDSFLEFLAIAPPHQQKMLLKSSTDEQLKLLIEIIYNIAMDNIPISDEDKRQLSKYKLGIRKVLAHEISRTQRRQRLIAVSSVFSIFIKYYSVH